ETDLTNQQIGSVPVRPRQVEKVVLRFFGRSLAEELARAAFGVFVSPEKATAPATTLLRDRNGIAQLRRIDSNERAVMMTHDSPSLLEALPGQSGEPSPQHRG